MGGSADIDVLSNDGLSPEALEKAIDEWLATHGEPAILLTDLGFGSCGQSSRMSARGRPGVAVIAGVNLAIALALVRSRGHEDLRSLLAHLRQRGQESVQIFLGGEPA